MQVRIHAQKVTLFFLIFLVLIVISLMLFYWQTIVTFFRSGTIPVTQILSPVLAFIVVLWAVFSNAYVRVQSQKAETALLISQKRFSELYKGSPVPYITLNNEGRVTMANLSALRLFNMNEAELYAQTLGAMLRHEKENALSVMLGKLHNGTVINREEVQIQPKEGPTLWVLLSVFSYGVAGERLVTIVDISKQKAIEAAKTEFVSLASHQLRTPISVIQWNLELLQSPKNGELTEKQVTYFEKIERNTSRMSTLINDFLSASKLELGTFATKTIGIPLEPFMKSIIEEFEIRAERKNITLNTRYEPPTFVMEADERLLHIIVSNLMSNAVKYTPNDGTVSLSYDVTEEGITIVVSDTGMGIPESEHVHLFTKFYRATNARKEISEGTGLGLHMVRRAAQMLGGNIAFNSVENEGTTFTVTLPRR